MKILGIDPGSTRVGYGIVEKQENELIYIDAGLLAIFSKDKGERLVELEASFLRLLKATKPDVAVIERLFFMKNLKTALEVAQSRGILTLLIVKHKIPLLEYTPLEIKQAITGHGMADKQSVANAVTKLLHLSELPVIDDATDGLAAAIMGSMMLPNTLKQKGR